jgi:murein DD-endopeptidase MepM/ murein hydrolase activator NlpD
MPRLPRVKLVGVLAATAAIIAACSSSSSSGGASTTVPANSGGGVTDVIVPDNFTAMTLTALGNGTFPFKGTDGKYHVAYDLQLTNASTVAAQLDKVEVVRGDDPTTVIATFTGKQLIDPTCAYGDCNRLRLLPSSPATDATLPPETSRALMLDFTFDTLDQAPKAVLHHLYGTAKASPPAKDATAVDYLTTPVNISAGTPRVISPPLRGDNWIALNGCCEVGFPHRTSLNSLNGQLRNSQRFAIDWKRTNDAGAFYTGDKTKNESYVDYGADVYAVADGTVVGVLDDVDANAPGVLPAQDPVLASKLTIENVDGNHVILDLGGGVYAMYAHFQKGSILVKVGDKVKRGDKLAKLGNTGNANASHLHFQLMDGPSLLGADALPYTFDKFSYEGQVDPEAIINADDYLTGTFLQGKLATGEARTDELPSNLAIIDFGT